MRRARLSLRLYVGAAEGSMELLSRYVSYEGGVSFFESWVLDEGWLGYVVSASGLMAS